jgi:molecular chaperone HscB
MKKADAAAANPSTSNSMNYFELFGLGSPRFGLDLAQVEKRYFELQRELHPDRVSASERPAAIQKSADVNQGYHVLKSPLKRAQHLLALHGIHVNTDNDTVKPDTALLTEIMDLRERLAADESIIGDLETREKETLEALGNAFNAEDHSRAASLTIRLNYLFKLLQDARMQDIA